MFERLCSFPHLHALPEVLPAMRNTPESDANSGDNSSVSHIGDKRCQDESGYVGEAQRHVSGSLAENISLA